MDYLKEMIRREGKILPGNILKVGNFLNQQIDIDLLKEIGKEIARLFRNDKPTKILTIESSGIALAVAAGFYLNVPVVFAKKHAGSNVDGSVYTAPVHSYTHNRDYTILVSRDYLRREDRVLLVDDFLAMGCALNGLTELVEKAHATLIGAAIGIEKCFQGGGDLLRKKGIRVESLAMIDSMTDDAVIFRE